MQVGTEPPDGQVVRFFTERIAELLGGAVDAEKDGGRDGGGGYAPDSDRTDELQRDGADVDQEQELQMDL